MVLRFLKLIKLKISGESYLICGNTKIDIFKISLDNTIV
jgi:hypothetical protein